MGNQRAEVQYKGEDCGGNRREGQPQDLHKSRSIRDPLRNPKMV
jgi:hypothetical protein